MRSRSASRARLRAWRSASLAIWLTTLQWSPTATAGTDFAWQLPPGFARPAVPADNPMSEAKVALGRRLFADPRLSVTGTQSCASCHDAALDFTDGRVVAVGATGAALSRNAPSLWNVAYQSSLGWDDPGDQSLEMQMRRPLFNAHPVELGLTGREPHLEQLLRDDRTMRAAFMVAFPADTEPVRMQNVIRAIAAFERTLIAGNSRFDRYVFRGEHALLSAVEKHGMDLFFSPQTGCSQCHNGLLLGGSWVDTDHPQARAHFARSVDSGAPKRVPSLRNVTRTAPYMHDGRFASLHAVLAHYERAALDPRADRRLHRPPLSPQDQAAVLAFLASLESPIAAAFELEHSATRP